MMTGQGWTDAGRHTAHSEIGTRTPSTGCGQPAEDALFRHDGTREGNRRGGCGVLTALGPTPGLVRPKAKLGTGVEGQEGQAGRALGRHQPAAASRVAKHPAGTRVPSCRKWPHRC